MSSLITRLIVSSAADKDIEGCKKPVQSGKGRWIAEDLTFGYGLNIPRTRHASEILKTTVQREGIIGLFLFLILSINSTF